MSNNGIESAIALRLKTGSVIPVTTAGRLELISELCFPRPEVDGNGERVLDENGSAVMSEPLVSLSREEILKLLDIP